MDLEETVYQDNSFSPIWDAAIESIYSGWKPEELKDTYNIEVERNHFHKDRRANVDKIINSVDENIRPELEQIRYRYEGRALEDAVKEDNDVSVYKEMFSDLSSGLGAAKLNDKYSFDLGRNWAMEDRAKNVETFVNNVSDEVLEALAPELEEFYQKYNLSRLKTLKNGISNDNGRSVDAILTDTRNYMKKKLGDKFDIAVVPEFRGELERVYDCVVHEVGFTQEASHFLEEIGPEEYEGKIIPLDDFRNKRFSYGGVAVTGVLAVSALFGFVLDSNKPSVSEAAAVHGEYSLGLAIEEVAENRFEVEKVQIVSDKGVETKLSATLSRLVKNARYDSLIITDTWECPEGILEPTKTSTFSNREYECIDPISRPIISGEPYSLGALEWKRDLDTDVLLTMYADRDSEKK
tara:strand:- start:14379 stop:15602 length:1224 start_codon:yes stop_codon:yes gene_type:complete